MVNTKQPGLILGISPLVPALVFCFGVAHSLPDCLRILENQQEGIVDTDDKIASGCFVVTEVFIFKTNCLH